MPETRTVRAARASRAGWHPRGDRARRRARWPAGLLALLVACVAGEALADAAAERVFRDARAYTVRVKAQIEWPFGDDPQGTMIGAGFLVDAERGWILTNAHVVGESPSTVHVAFADQPFQPARKVYVDPFTDVAVLALPGGAAGRSAAPIACDAEPAVGQAVGVFGHPLDIPFTGSRGIISGRTDKLGPEFLQMDATVDPGNSGGPVIHLGQRRVIGIATAGARAAKADRLNFATPMKDVCRILELLRAGRPAEPPRLGVALMEDEDDRCTMRVGTVYDPDRWPLRPGDRIVAIAEPKRPLATLGDLVRELRGREGVVPLLIDRDGEPQVIEVRPLFQTSIVARRGVVIDGALIAPLEFDDVQELDDPPALIVHSVDPGSHADMMGVVPSDMLQTVDGQVMPDLETLIEFLRQRKEPAPLELTLRRWNLADRRLFEYQVRVLPGESVEVFGPEPESVSIVPD